MADFLRGMLSAKPIRDLDAERMRAQAIADHGLELRQRRAMREMPAFLRGDPRAEMSLAAMGIGKGPESQREAQRYADAQARSVEAADERRQKFAWEKQFAQEGRDMSKMLSDRAFQQKQYEIDWREERAGKADKRYQQEQDLKMLDDIEGRADKLRARKKGEARDVKAEEERKLRMKLTRMRMEDIETQRKSARDKAALESQSIEGMDEMMTDFARVVLGEPETDSLIDIADRGIKIDQMKNKMMKMYEGLGGPNLPPDRRGGIWAQIKDQIDPQGELMRGYAMAERKMAFQMESEGRLARERAKMEKTVQTMNASSDSDFKSNIKNLNEIEITDVIEMLGEEIASMQAQPSQDPRAQMALGQTQKRYQIAVEQLAKKKPKGKVKRKEMPRTEILPFPFNLPGSGAVLDFLR